MTALPHRPLTIAQFVPSLDAGGVEQGVLETNAALAQRGHRSLVIASGGQLAERIAADGGQFIPWQLGRKSPTSLLQVRPLRRWIREQQIDILHARSRLPAWLCFLAWRRLPAGDRPRFVTTVHGLHSVNGYSAVMTFGERVEVVSDTTRHYVLQNYPRTDPNKLVLIPRGVAPADFPHNFQPTGAWRTNWDREHPHLRNKTLITLAGRLTRLKGHHDLLEVLTRARAQPGGESLHALIVGTEDPKRQAYARKLRDAVTAQGLADHVTFTGHRSDIREILAISAAVLSLSTKPEGFGRAVLESVALGRPTLGYDHGGVGEVLGRVYPAGLVPLGDTAAMADRVLAAVHGQLPLPAGIDGLTLAATCQKTLALYESLAATPRR